MVADIPSSRPKLPKRQALAVSASIALGLLFLLMGSVLTSIFEIAILQGSGQYAGFLFTLALFLIAWGSSLFAIGVGILVYINIRLPGSSNRTPSVLGSMAIILMVVCASFTGYVLYSSLPPRPIVRILDLSESSTSMDSPVTNPGGLAPYINQSTTASPNFKASVFANGVASWNLSALNANGSTADFVAGSFSQEMNLTVSTSQLFGPLYPSPGIYTIQITVIREQAKISEQLSMQILTPLSIIDVAGQMSVYNGSAASFNVSYSGGTAPYSINWSVTQSFPYTGEGTLIGNGNTSHPTIRLYGNEAFTYPQYAQVAVIIRDSVGSIEWSYSIVKII